MAQLLLVDGTLHGLGLKGSKDPSFCAVLTDSCEAVLGSLLDEGIRVGRSLEDHWKDGLDVVVGVTGSQLLEHGGESQACVFRDLGPERVNRFDDVFEDLRGHGAGVREEILVK